MIKTISFASLIDNMRIFEYKSDIDQNLTGFVIHVFDDGCAVVFCHEDLTIIDTKTMIFPKKPPTERLIHQFQSIAAIYVHFSMLAESMLGELCSHENGQYGIIVSAPYCSRVLVKIVSADIHENSENMEKNIILTNIAVKKAIDAYRSWHVSKITIL